MEKRNGMLYPMMVIAAISVILFSVVGIAAMTGHIPSALSQKGDVATETQEDKFGKDAKQPETGKSKVSYLASKNEQRLGDNTQQRIAMNCVSCGVVESVQVRQMKGQGTGLGVAGGAVLGGVLGHQVGSGRGNDLATVAGAVGGGFLGNEVEKNARKTTQYVIRVRMEDNTFRTVTQSAQPSVGTGDRVRIENGTVVARG